MNWLSWSVPAAISTALGGVTVALLGYMFQQRSKERDRMRELENENDDLHEKNYLLRRKNSDLERRLRAING